MSGFYARSTQSVRSTARAFEFSWYDASTLTSPQPRVLIIDDEPAILAVYPEVLGSDYFVAVASTGRRALELIEREPEFDVILCDYMLPDLDGREMYEELKVRAPHMLDRLMFCSGGLVSERAREFVDSIENPMLEKPIPIDRLCEEIANLVKRRQSPP